MPAYLALDLAFGAVGFPNAYYDAANSRTLLGGVSSNGTSAWAGGIQIAQIDHANGDNCTQFQLDSTQGGDNHNIPAVIILPSGKAAALWTYHPGNTMFFKRQSSAGNVETTGWTANSAFGADNGSAGSLETYEYPFMCTLSTDVAAGRLHVFYSAAIGAAGADGHRVLRHRTSDDEGTTWSAYETVLDIANTTAYFWISTDWTSRIDIACSETQPAIGNTCSCYHVYYNYNGTNGRYYKSDGTLTGSYTSNVLNTPLGKTDITTVLAGTDTGAGGTRVWPNDIWTNGATPVILLAVAILPAASNTLTSETFRQARWNGSSWTNTSVDIATAASGFSQNGVTIGCALDRSNINQVAIGIQSTKQEFALYTTADSGATWTLTGNITSGSTLNNYQIRYVEKAPTSPSHLKWIWNYGTYVAANNFVMQAYGANDTTPVASKQYVKHTFTGTATTAIGTGTPAEIGGIPRYAVSGSTPTIDNANRVMQSGGTNLTCISADAPAGSTDQYASLSVNPVTFINGDIFGINLRATAYLAGGNPTSYSAMFYASGTDGAHSNFLLDYNLNGAFNARFNVGALPTLMSATAFGSLVANTAYTLQLWAQNLANGSVQLTVGVNGTIIYTYNDNVKKVTAAGYPLVYLKAGAAGSNSTGMHADAWNVYDFATAYTFTGPSSGSLNVASTDFTITPNGDMTGVTLTFGTTGAGSFNPATLTWSTGDTSAKTTKYTPTSTSGSPHTLSVVSSGIAITDPATLAYTVLGGGGFKYFQIFIGA